MPDPFPAAVFVGEELGRYGFPKGHPFGPDRLDTFWGEARRRGLAARVQEAAPATAGPAVIERFHEADYVARVRRLSERGEGFLDMGDTPAFPGVYEAAATVVGSAVAAAEGILDGRWRRAFSPIGGLHHARRDGASGFCVFNDCGVVIETLKAVNGLGRIAYVDIDAHHGDGVYYGFASDPAVWIADIHQDGHTLFPGTGDADEQGTGAAVGTKLNIPLTPGADDRVFRQVWPRVEAHVEAAEPELILLQCGADSLAGDPLANLGYSWRAHDHAARRLRQLADRLCHGRLLALGGGGYDRANLASAWCAVTEALAED
ncbi:MAG TPA: acetoin utilization protein AcuC [Gammaproteobacteria bacterium]|nr:acetoin utilization protein AcuC [Gammaproteobacteria bacterium]